MDGFTLPDKPMPCILNNFNERIGLISQCYTSCVVTGTDNYLNSSYPDQYFGGLVGESFGKLENCYSTSEVNVDSESW